MMVESKNGGILNKKQSLINTPNISRLASKHTTSQKLTSNDPFKVLLHFSNRSIASSVQIIFVFHRRFQNKHNCDKVEKK